MTQDRFEHAGKRFADLCRTMAELRARCQWDADQTHETLKEYLIEEAYELLEVLGAGATPAKRCEELGDLLFQIVFHSEIAAEAGEFDAADVAKGIDEKLIRRHPHLFGGEGEHPTWEQIKAAERGPQTGRLDNIPRQLPALLRALRTSEKAAAVGFDWPDLKGVTDKVREEYAELEETLPDGGEETFHEMGDVIFSLVNLSRHLQLDPEAALTATIEKFHRRFRHIEARLLEQNQEIEAASLDEMETLWLEAKRIETKHIEG